MITLKDFCETVNYRITEGSAFGWNCYGSNAYTLDSWDGNQEGHNISVVFDTVTQTVYEMSACDYTRNRAYRWINPDFIEFYRTEAKQRNISFTDFGSTSSTEEAWEGVNYTTLEVPDDFLEKASAIVNGEDYSTNVSVPIELPDDELFMLMKIAHERDITFNQLVEQALVVAIERYERNDSF